jgi:hypothetical protein
MACLATSLDLKGDLNSPAAEQCHQDPFGIRDMSYPHDTMVVRDTARHPIC